MNFCENSYSYSYAFIIFYIDIHSFLWYLPIIHKPSYYTEQREKLNERENKNKCYSLVIYSSLKRSYIQGYKEKKKSIRRRLKFTTLIRPIRPGPKTEGNCFLHPINCDWHPTNFLKFHYVLVLHRTTITLRKKLSASQMSLADKNIRRPFFHNCR